MAAGGHFLGGSQSPRDRHSRAGTNFNQTRLGGGTGGPDPRLRPFSDHPSGSVTTAIGGKIRRGSKSSSDHCILPFGIPFPESTGTLLPCPCQSSKHTSDGSPPRGISDDRHTAVDDDEGPSLRVITGAVVSPPPICINTDTTSGPPSNCSRASRYSHRNWWRQLGITALTHCPSGLFLFNGHALSIPHNPTGTLAKKRTVTEIHVPLHARTSNAWTNLPTSQSQTNLSSHSSSWRVRNFLNSSWNVTARWCSL